MTIKEIQLKERELDLKERELEIRSKEADINLKIAVIEILKSNQHDKMIGYKDTETGDIIHENLFKLIYKLNEL